MRAVASTRKANRSSRLQELWAEMSSCRRELFVVFFLDAESTVFRSEILFRGSKERVMVSMTGVARTAMRHGAHSICVAHNHPIGGAEPSAEDVRFTRRLRVVMTVVGIPLVDHIIVARSGVYSMAEQGPWEAPLEELAVLIGDPGQLHTPAMGARS